MPVNPTMSEPYTSRTNVMFDHELLADVVEVSLAHFLETISNILLDQLVFLANSKQGGAVSWSIVCILGRLFRQRA